MVPPTGRRPNFFILGAPKCGTTSMAGWLQTHPQVFISRLKEPHYFNTDDRQCIRTLDPYERLFAAAGPEHRAIGEASVWYLYSEVAVTNILKYQPQARFIVMLRNPMEMAPALHAEMLLSGHENIRDFHQAWHVQEDRCRGQMLPRLTWATRRLQYGTVCSLGAQLQRLFSIVGKERVLTVFLDDMVSDPRQSYLRTLRFLDLDDDGRVTFPALNTSRVLRWPRLVRTLFILGQLKAYAGISVNFGLSRQLVRASHRQSPRQTLPQATRDMLSNYFADDILLLQELVGRDLRHWVTSARCPEPCA